MIPDKPVAPVITYDGVPELTPPVQLSEPEPTEPIVNDMADAVTEAGLDPNLWGIKSAWQLSSGVMRYSFERLPQEPVGAVLSPAEIDLVVLEPEARLVSSRGPSGPPVSYLVALGDMQIGKVDGDGIEGTMMRTARTLRGAWERLEWYATRFNITEVVIGFLGDHIEGFNSQGGANAWRTPMGLTEQIRSTRWIMLHAMQLFAQAGLPVRMVAIPGNHGEAVRFGRGITTYDDSHDTDALVAVSEMASLNPEAFGHVSFYVPTTDELSVALDLNGTLTVFTHGHQMKPRFYHDWVRKQAYNRGSLFRDCDLVLMGHYHHEYLEASGDRMIVQVPTLEGGSTWWKHQSGEESKQGLLVAVVGGGGIDNIEYVR